MKERRRGPAGGSGDASCPQLDGVGAVPARCHTQHAKARQRGSQRRIAAAKRFQSWTTEKNSTNQQRKRSNGLFHNKLPRTSHNTGHHGTGARKKARLGFTQGEEAAAPYSLSLSLSQITTSHAARAIYPCAHLFLSQPYWHAPRPGKQKEKYAVSPLCLRKACSFLPFSNKS